jgi:hypothetical protein
MQLSTHSCQSSPSRVVNVFVGTSGWLNPAVSSELAIEPDESQQTFEFDLRRRGRRWQADFATEAF